LDSGTFARWALKKKKKDIRVIPRERNFFPPSNSFPVDASLKVGQFNLKIEGDSFIGDERTTPFYREKKSPFCSHYDPLELISLKKFFLNS
jgi:hypothetical protein